jgi:hypothetical protein
MPAQVYVGAIGMILMGAPGPSPAARVLGLLGACAYVIVFGGVGSLIAARNSRSRVVGFILGLFGPMGWLVAGMKFRNPNLPASFTKQSPPSHYRCQHCGHGMPSLLMSCPKCGRGFRNYESMKRSQEVAETIWLLVLAAIICIVVYNYMHKK